MKTPSIPAIWGMTVLLTLLCACHSPGTLSDTDRRTLQGMIRQADSFPDRAIPLADSAVRLANQGHSPDTILYRFWMAKANAFIRNGAVSRAIQLLDSIAPIAEADEQWDAFGRISLRSSRLMMDAPEDTIRARHDRVGYCRDAVRAFDRADRRLEKAEALSLLGRILSPIDPQWSVDTLILAADIFLGENGSRQEFLSCAYRIGYHSSGLGNPSVTKEYLDKTLEIFRSTPDSPRVAPLMRVYASSQKQSNPDTALYYFDLADRLDPGMVDELDHYKAGAFERATILMNKGRLKEAASDLERCLAYALRANQSDLAAGTELKLGECAFLQGDKASADRHLSRALAIADTNPNAAFFIKPTLERYLIHGMENGDSNLVRLLQAKLTSPAVSGRLSGQGMTLVSGTVSDVRSIPAEVMLPRWLNKFMDEHPLLLRSLVFGMLVALVGAILLKRRSSGILIKNFESYQRILREGRAYRHSMFADSNGTGGADSLNKKAWLMYRLEEWVISETPFRDPDFGVEKMAGHLGVSLPVLDEAVKSHVDIDAVNYLDHLRVEHSINLMKGKGRKRLSLSKIARESGFKGILVFRKVFHIVTGVSVGRYRSYCRSAST